MRKLKVSVRKIHFQGGIEIRVRVARRDERETRVGVAIVVTRETRVGVDRDECFQILGIQGASRWQ